MPASVFAGAQRLEIELEPAEEAPQRPGLEPGQLDPPARDHRLGAGEQAPLPPKPLSLQRQPKSKVPRQGAGHAGDDAQQQRQQQHRQDSACAEPPGNALIDKRSEEHTSELQSLMRSSYAV